MRAFFQKSAASSDDDPVRRHRPGVRVDRDGCGEHRAARQKFNEGVGLLEASKYEDAEKALLEARSNAGVDPELRFRAAYDLGMAYAAHADKVKGDWRVYDAVAGTGGQVLLFVHPAG